jgi:peptidoglycan DL-endopeptidase CwlO
VNRLKRLLSTIFASILLLFVLPITSAFATTEEELLEIAKDQLGVKYKFGGTTTAGFDCSGYMRYVFEQVGVELPRTSSQQYEEGEKVAKEDLKPGDLVFFAGTYKAGISHAGIYIGDNEFISATSSSGVSIASIDSSYWGPKYFGAKRVIELEDELPAGQFHDVTENHSAFIAIKALSIDGIINGFEGSYFKPDDFVTRGQAAAILNRNLNLSSSSSTSFKDVSKAMSFAKDIAAIKEAGIITGFNDGSFRPNDKLTRAQLAIIIERAYKINEKSVGAASTSSFTYNDISPTYWAYDAIVALKSIDQTTTFNTSIFRATANATRADFAAAAYSAINTK